MLIHKVVFCEGDMGCDCIDRSFRASQSGKSGTNANYPDSLLELIAVLAEPAGHEGSRL